MCDNRQIFKLKQTFLFRQILDTQKNIWGEPSYVIRLPERHILDLNKNLKKVPWPGRNKQNEFDRAGRNGRSHNGHLMVRAFNRGGRFLLPVRQNRSGRTTQRHQGK
jgi:hypothetical protein